jgi:hypothetical protein
MTSGSRHGQVPSQGAMFFSKITVFEVIFTVDGRAWTFVSSRRFLGGCISFQLHFAKSAAK